MLKWYNESIYNKGTDNELNNNARGVRSTKKNLELNNKQG